MVEDATEAAGRGADWSHLRPDPAHTDEITPVDLLPVVAAGFAVPQFVPQIRKLRRTGDTAGLSTTWGLLTGVNNTAWFGYFVASHYWFALIPSSSAALLGGGLGVMLHRRRPLPGRRLALVVGWALVLAAAAGVDRSLLGAALTGAYLIQVVPAVAAAHRTDEPTGIARGTWRLILAEVSCWTVFGAARRDGPLLVLGLTGVAAALLVLRRARAGGDHGPVRGRLGRAGRVGRVRGGRAGTAGPGWPG